MRVKKVEDPLAKFTDEQLDYMLYVDGLTKEEIREQMGKNLNTTLEIIQDVSSMHSEDLNQTEEHKSESS